MDRTGRVLSHYDLQGNVISCNRFGHGHINETYLVVTDRPHLYVLQKISSVAFKNPVGLMENIIRVTDFLHSKGADIRHALTLVPQASGEKYLEKSGEYWRMYEYITDSLCLDRAESPEDFRQSGAAFGQFCGQLTGFDASALCEVIPGFHHTPGRFKRLQQAAERDIMGRKKEVLPELEFYLSRKQETGRLLGWHEAGLLPLRVTHNDTKLNNVMLDARFRTPLCVIDLDTVMPGFAAYDFGDSIRFGASTAPEDEKDLDKVSLSLDLYSAYAEGFLGACAGQLTPKEIESLPVGAWMMTMECGARFLTDYLEGDVYFHTAYPEHNLVRCKAQMRLAADLEKKQTLMLQILQSILEKQG